MAVHIRLQRKGNTNRPFYHVVAADHRARRDGRFLEKLGYYDPSTEPSTIELKGERLQHWYSQGAQLSETVAQIAKVKQIALSRNTTK